MVAVVLMLCLLLTACGGQTSQVAPELLDSTPSSTTPTKTEPVESEPVAETPEQEPEKEQMTSEEPEEPVAPQKSYTSPKKFTIEGKWKNVGTYTFGQVQSGSIIVFDGTNCNVFSPMDTYAFYKDGDEFKLDCTSFLFSETLSFVVKIVDKEHIDIYRGANYLEMKKVD